MTMAITMHEHFERWRKGTIRWCARLAILGFVLMIAAAALNSSLFVAGILLGLIAMLFLGLQPLGATLGAGLRQPGVLPDIMRAGAVLGGIGSLILAWHVARGQVEDRMIITGILILAGGIGVANALRPPRLQSRLLPISMVIGIGLGLFFARLPVLFKGVNEKAYYNQMRSLAVDVQQWQQLMRADSGYYAAVPDSSMFPRLQRGGLLQLRLERTGDGYRAWTSSQRSIHDSSAACTRALRQPSRRRHRARSSACCTLTSSCSRWRGRGSWR